MYLIKKSPSESWQLDVVWNTVNEFIHVIAARIPEMWQKRPGRVLSIHAGAPELPFLADNAPNHPALS